MTQRSGLLHHARLGAVAVLSLTACALGGGGNFPPDTSARTGRDLPARFERTDRAADTASSAAARACHSPMRDPRDGTELRLERAIAPRGDYSVAAGRYGVGAGELLRLDCSTGAPIGIVPR